LLEARVVVTSYNQHVRLLSPEPFGGLAITRVYSGVGADIVRKSSTFINSIASEMVQPDNVRKGLFIANDARRRAQKLY